MSFSTLKADLNLCGKDEDRMIHVLDLDEQHRKMECLCSFVHDLCRIQPDHTCHSACAVLQAHHGNVVLCGVHCAIRAQAKAILVRLVRYS